jgi:hypothetical protein
MLKGMRAAILALCLVLAGYGLFDQMRSSAAEDATLQSQRSAGQAPAQVVKPINMDEPMEGGMMKKGMMKSDVKKSAEKKEKEMEKMLKKEEQSMPSSPER